ncbi:hypothetical protein IFM89_037246, partial [Coptis chinensis]
MHVAEHIMLRLHGKMNITEDPELPDLVRVYVLEPRTAGESSRRLH